MEGVPKFQKVGHVTLPDPFWPNFAFFRWGIPVANVHAKFEVPVQWVASVQIYITYDTIRIR